MSHGVVRFCFLWIGFRSVFSSSWTNYAFNTDKNPSGLKPKAAWDTECDAFVTGSRAAQGFTQVELERMVAKLPIGYNASIPVYGWGGNYTSFDEGYDPEGDVYHLCEWTCNADECDECPDATSEAVCVNCVRNLYYKGSTCDCPSREKMVGTGDNAFCKPCVYGHLTNTTDSNDPECNVKRHKLERWDAMCPATLDCGGLELPDCFDWTDFDHMNRSEIHSTHDGSYHHYLNSTHASGYDHMIEIKSVEVGVADDRTTDVNRTRLNIEVDLNRLHGQHGLAVSVTMMKNHTDVRCIQNIRNESVFASELATLPIPNYVHRPHQVELQYPNFCFGNAQTNRSLAFIGVILTSGSGACFGALRNDPANTAVDTTNRLWNNETVWFHRQWGLLTLTRGNFTFNYSLTSFEWLDDLIGNNVNATFTAISKPPTLKVCHYDLGFVDDVDGMRHPPEDSCYFQNWVMQGEYVFLLFETDGLCTGFLEVEDISWWDSNTGVTYGGSSPGPMAYTSEMSHGWPNLLLNATTTGPRSRCKTMVNAGIPREGVWDLSFSVTFSITNTQDANTNNVSTTENANIATSDNPTRRRLSTWTQSYSVTRHPAFERRLENSPVAEHPYSLEVRSLSTVGKDTKEQDDHKTILMIVTMVCAILLLVGFCCFGGIGTLFMIWQIWQSKRRPERTPIPARPVDYNPRFNQGGSWDPTR